MGSARKTLARPWPQIRMVPEMQQQHQKTAGSQPSRRQTLGGCLRRGIPSSVGLGTGPFCRLPPTLGGPGSGRPTTTQQCSRAGEEEQRAWCSVSCLEFLKLSFYITTTKITIWAILIVIWTANTVYWTPCSELGTVLCVPDVLAAAWGTAPALPCAAFVTQISELVAHLLDGQNGNDVKKAFWRCFSGGTVRCALAVHLVSHSWGLVWLRLEDEKEGEEIHIPKLINE